MLRTRDMAMGMVRRTCRKTWHPWSSRSRNLSSASIHQRAIVADSLPTFETGTLDQLRENTTRGCLKIPPRDEHVWMSQRPGSQTTASFGRATLKAGGG